MDAIETVDHNKKRKICCQRASSLHESEWWQSGAGILFWVRAFEKNCSLRVLHHETRRDLAGRATRSARRSLRHDSLASEKGCLRIQTANTVSSLTRLFCEADRWLRDSETARPQRDCGEMMP